MKKEGGARSFAPLIFGLTFAICMAPSSIFAAADLADAPMASGTSVQIKPNVMFVLDDSGSMGWSFMPDHVRSFAAAVPADKRYGYVSSQCNAVYYNPNIGYKPPVKADGSSYPNSVFTDAWNDGFDTAKGKVNLSNAFRAYDSTSSNGVGEDEAGPAYYYKYVKSDAEILKFGHEPLSYVYTSSGALVTTATVSGKPTFYGECASKVGSKPGSEVFEKVTVADGTKEAQNFANWYSYYRIRLGMMKSAAGFAFTNLPNPENFRIGFSTHSYTGFSSTNSEFQKIDDYCGASDACDQRTSFYSKLYGATPSGGTPLRAAMSKIGRMYAGKLLSGTDDPVLYSCQQNFLILSTDGYWNGAGPVSISGESGVGDVDSGASVPRPLRDDLAKANTLADTAMYYYETDLRTPELGNCTGALGLDVCENNVPTAGKDNNNKQHMTTFTLGLGVDGTLKYADDYESGGSLDFTRLLDGSAKWPDPTVSEDARRIDDLWHAAVNGRGYYYSAKTPDAVVAGIGKALSSVSARTGSGAAAATSNLEPVAGDNFAYVASYRTQMWDGDVQAREINLTTGALSAEVDKIWSASDRLKAISPSKREIFTKGATGLIEFKAANLSSAVTAGLFDPCPTDGRGMLTQCPLPAAATPESLINFIRGDDSYEYQASNASQFYRDRESVLGDIVSSQPVYVKAPPFAYTDTGYANYAKSNASRTGVVLVGANDGMLHAFNSVTGDELWAYVPSPVVPYLYRLADSNYENNHRYYVDGTIAVGDVCFAANCKDNGNDWKTIVVGGLGKGGRGYYALDVTAPAAPKLLWEFTVENDSDLGFSYGNPVITKLNGKWVAVFASGYNNVSPGDGKGRIFVVDAEKGTKLAEIVTDNGLADPALSGIAKIANWVDNAKFDNTTRYVYGGDLGGSVWRIDLDEGKAEKLAQLGAADGAKQSITTKPELALVKHGGIMHRVIYVGTGRYLGTTDLTDTSMQSFYAIREPLTSIWGTFREEANVVDQTLTKINETSRTMSSNAVNWSTSPGWFVDFDIDLGERINVDFRLNAGVLVVVTNIPEANACNVGGYSYIYFFDYRTGSYVTTVEGEVVGYRFANALSVGINVIRVNGKSVAIVTTSDNRHTPISVPEYGASSTLKRMLWRELIND
jgi:type IV pilus assembly protein PilY1